MLSEQPDTHEIVAFIFSSDVTERIVREQTIQRISELEYDVLGIINTITGEFHVSNIISDLMSEQYKLEGDYDTECRRFVEELILEDERNEMHKKLALEYVVKQLAETKIFTLTFFILEHKQVKRKQFHFTYLDEYHTRILFFQNDITDLYRMEQERLRTIEKALVQAQEANDAKTEFFSNMSHDMRTPMNGILGLAALMKDKDNIEEIKQDADQILLSGQYLLNLINDTLDMNKIESGNMELHLQPINSEEVFQNIVSSARLMAEDKEQELILNVPKIAQGDWKTVMADASRLEQIFMNVIANAIKYTPYHGKIEISMETLLITDDIVTDKYIVRDHGIGMKEEFLPHMFEAFMQEGRASFDRQNGTGLGMAIVKKLVELMDGEIKVDSKENEGTTVTIILTYPVSGEKIKCSEVEKLDLSILKGQKVLLCEDHPLNSKIAIQLLEKKQMQVVLAVNGKIGVDIFEHSAPGEFAAVLMDVKMPVMNGIEATKEIRKLKRPDAGTIPIIAITANAFENDIETCLNVGMNAHISKPFDVAKLYGTLEEEINKTV